MPNVEYRSVAPGAFAGFTRRRVLRAGATALASTSVLAACGRSSGETAAAPAASLDKPASVVWFNFEGTGVNLDGNNKSIETFRAKYPNITVENAAQPAAGEAYYAKFFSLVAAGTAPDLAEGSARDVADLVARKLVLPIQRYVTRDKYDLSDFVPRALDQYRIKNELWALPRDFPNRELTYNVTAFQKAGVPLPASDWKNPNWTWDAFLDAARRVTAADGSVFGFNTGKGIRQWAVWVWGNGGEVFDEVKLECTLTQPPAVEALQFLQDLIHKHRVWPETVPQGRNFQNGGVVIQETAPIMLGNVRRGVADKFVWDVVMHPRGKNGKYAAAGGGAGWNIGANTKVPDATWELLKHISSVEEQLQLCGLGATIGSRRSVMTNSCFVQSPPEHVKLFLDGSDYLHIDPRVPNWDEVDRIMTEELVSLWSGQKPAQQVAASIKSKVDPVLKKPVG